MALSHDIDAVRVQLESSNTPAEQIPLLCQIAELLLQRAQSYRPSGSPADARSCYHELFNIVRSFDLPQTESFPLTGPGSVPPEQNSNYDALTCELAAERCLVNLYKRCDNFKSALLHSQRVAALAADMHESEKQMIRRELADRYDLEHYLHVLEHHRVQHSQLSAAELSAEKASQAKSAFLTAMSHELRTPLNGVIGAINLLVHTPLRPRPSR